MKKNLLKLSFGLSMVALSFNASAQCPVITCNNDITVTTDAASCDAVVTYTMPTAVDTCNPSGSQTFSYTGAMQTFVVPNGVSMISVDAYGAQGGSNSPSTNVNYGGRVQADFPVTAGTTIYVYVGEQPNGLTGGWNGGGNGETAGQGGGGASDIRIGGTTLNDRVIVAGGAGGGGFWSSQEVHGGEGGGLIGANGYRTNFSTAPGGEGGTQTGSGNGTCVSLNNPAMAGTFGIGGSPSGCGCEGYGGGGGWYGGAASGNCRGGGGGSSYTAGGATNVVHTQGVRAGHGEIVISWTGTAPNVAQIAGLPSGATFPIGSTTNTFVAESNGNVDTCSFVVTVVDNEAPTITCPGVNIEVCEGEVVSAPAPSTADNCTGETVSYVTTGATTVSGTDSVSAVVFNPGTTTIWYIVTDAAGNQDSCSFDVMVNAAPVVSLDPFSTDSLCNYDAAIALPVGTPASGTYSGTGISGSDFDPAISGDGLFYITYSVTDSLGCVGSDSSAIYVDGCASVQNLGELAEVSVYPNPTSGVVTLSCENVSGAFNYAVTTLEGRIVRENATVNTSSVTIDLSEEPDGIYLIRIEQGEKQHTVKLVKD